MSLVYYDKERERWPQLNDQRLSEDEARIAIIKLQRHFMSKAVFRPHNPIEVKFRGTGSSSALAHDIVFAHESEFGCLSWLTIAHEFSHCWDMQLYPDRWQRHNKHHAKLTSRVCRYIIKMGWNTGVLAHRVAMRALAKTKRTQKAASPPSTDSRISKRREQIKKLERRIKALTTRLKKAQRSLSALERNKKC